jgi:hypothetical protein
MSDKQGSPIFTPELAAQICVYLAEGLSLRGVEKQPGMPAKSTVLKWLLEGEAYKAHGEQAHEKAIFVDQYARAREVQADVLADETLDIADESTYDTTTDENGREIVNTNHIQRDRLRVDTRKWLAGKLRPKKYGEKLETKSEVSGPNGAPLAIAITWDDGQSGSK